MDRYKTLGTTNIVIICRLFPHQSQRVKETTPTLQKKTLEKRRLSWKPSKTSTQPSYVSSPPSCLGICQVNQINLHLICHTTLPTFSPVDAGCFPESWWFQVTVAVSLPFPLNKNRREGIYIFIERETVTVDVSKHNLIALLLESDPFWIWQQIDAVAYLFWRLKNGFFTGISDRRWRFPYPSN